MAKRPPEVIEGSYSVVEQRHKGHEPIFNNWRNALPLLGLLGIRLLWLLATRH